MNHLKQIASLGFCLGPGVAAAEWNAGNINDLRPGQRVMVSYQNAHGVLVANRIEQKPLRYEGTVKAIDPQTRKLTVHHRAMNKKFEIAGDCRVMLRDERTGTLTDVKPGDRVTIVYETPDNTATARRIEQSSATYAGTLTAIDLNERTIKAKQMFGSKKFNLADNCTIVLEQKTEAQMRDLKPGDALVISYEPVNGVNVVNRIARNEGPAESSSEMTAIAP